MQFMSFSFDYIIVVSSNDSQTLQKNLLIDRTDHDRRFIEVNIRLIEENWSHETRYRVYRHKMF